MHLINNSNRRKELKIPAQRPALLALSPVPLEILCVGRPWVCACRPRTEAEVLALHRVLCLAPMPYAQKQKTDPLLNLKS